MATSLSCILILSVSRVDKVPENPAARGGVGQRPLKLQNRILKFIVASFGLDSLLLTEGNTLDPCDEIWE
jgi:hypothetical protein